MLVNCDIWTEVDFGAGPVLIRCTEVGEHVNHRCEVFITVQEANEPVEDQLTRHNVFDRRAG